MNVIPIAALTIGAALLAAGLRMSKRQAKPGDGGDGGSWSGGDDSSSDCDAGDGGGDGGGCD